MSVFEIPLRPSVPQHFSITLGNVSYGMSLQWRDAFAQCWVLDLSDSDGNVLVAGVALVTGADLMAQYPEIGFGGQLRIGTDGNPDLQPTFDSLGVTSHMYYISP